MVDPGGNQDLLFTVLIIKRSSHSISDLWLLTRGQGLYLEKEIVQIWNKLISTNLVPKNFLQNYDNSYPPHLLGEGIYRTQNYLFSGTPTSAAKSTARGKNYLSYPPAASHTARARFIRSYQHLLHSPFRGI